VEGARDLASDDLKPGSSSLLVMVTAPPRVAINVVASSPEVRTSSDKSWFPPLLIGPDDLEVSGPEHGTRCTGDGATAYACGCCRPVPEGGRQTSNRWILC
jgi:hypothetical protein